MLKSRTASAVSKDSGPLADSQYKNRLCFWIIFAWDLENASKEKNRDLLTVAGTIAIIRVVYA